MNNIEFFLGTEERIDDFNKKVISINKDKNVNFSYLNSNEKDSDTRFENENGTGSYGNFNYLQFYVGTLPLRTLPGKGLRFSDKNTLYPNELIETENVNVAPSVITLDFSKKMEENNPFFFGEIEKEEGLNFNYGKGIKVDNIFNEDQNIIRKGLVLNYNEDLFNINQNDELTINISTLIDNMFLDEYQQKLGFKIGSLLVEKIENDSLFRNDIKRALGI